MSDEADTGESSEAPIKTLEAAEEILRGRELDRILGYIRLKMDVALAANSELSSMRAQMVQMGSFLIVALVIGTGGVQVILGWDIQPIAISAFSAAVVAMAVFSVTRTSATYTDIVMDEFLALETVYSLIVWENVDNLDALAKEIISIERAIELFDIDGVGQLVELAAERGRATRDGLKLGICGEHGGDPASIAFCEKTGLDYVSASPYRVPIARLAAAQASLRAG